MSGLEHLKEKLAKKAAELGFSAIRVARAGKLEDAARKLEKWLNSGMHGKMQYMANHFEKRVDPTKLVPGARSVISFSFNYYQPPRELPEESFRISTYAWGDDYHKVLKKKLFGLLDFIRQEAGDVTGRVFVDSAPVLEKAWAVQSGLGWMGKHTNMITKKAGSYFFLAEIIIDLELPPDPPATDHCGTCTRCIEACPTQAIVEPYLLDARKCISYLTIELRDKELPESFAGKTGSWIFGCDICQEVCPWNRFAQPHDEPSFHPAPDLLEMTRDDWEHLTREKFNELFSKSAVQRTGFEGLKRNIRFAASSGPPGKPAKTPE